MAASNHPETDEPVISIGTLAEKLGLSVSTIRKYESEGLLIAHRTASGHRRFSIEDVDRVRNIQHMIHDLGLNIEGIRRIQAMLPCWELLPCSEETREKCPAFMDNRQPCWVSRGLGSAEHDNERRKCIVYRLGSQSAEDIKHLLHEQKSPCNPCQAVRELLERKQK